MISLGCFDSDVTGATCDAYLKEVARATRVPLAEVKPGVDRIELRKYAPPSPGAMGVAAVQRALQATGFFPGGKADGICGYRTQSAIRLFQEYVRTVEKLDCAPDGRFGPQTQKHLERWLDGGITPNWTPAIEQWKSGQTGGSEFGEWLALLEQVKARYATNPNRVLRMVEAFAGKSDTRKITNWDFSPKANVHLIGIRRDRFSGKFDDIFVLLIKGLVFQFQGSTEPGASSHPKGRPFLVQGQHDYHFGWHQRTYLALRPEGPGVLVVRSKDDRFDDGDLAGGLEANGTINIHWGGKGLAFDVNSWSEGCQVINGTFYMNAQGELIDCSAFAARNNGELASDPKKTRGAYNVLLDLVTALASDLGGNSVKYTLLVEPDLDLSPVLKQRLAETAARVADMV